MEQMTTVYNVCFNGHEWKREQMVNMDTGVTDYEKCPKCGASIQQQGISEFSN